MPNSSLCRAFFTETNCFLAEQNALGSQYWKSSSRRPTSQPEYLLQYFGSVSSSEMTNSVSSSVVARPATGPRLAFLCSALSFIQSCKFMPFLWWSAMKGHHGHLQLVVSLGGKAQAIEHTV